MSDRRHPASMALPAKIPLKRNEGDRYEGYLKQTDTEARQPSTRTYEFERFHEGTEWGSSQAWPMSCQRSVSCRVSHLVSFHDQPGHTPT